MLEERKQHWSKEVEATYVVAKLAWRGFLKHGTPSARAMYVSALAEHYLAEAHLEAVSSSRAIVQPKLYDHQVS